MAAVLDTFEFVAGDTLPMINGVVVDDDGTTPVDITGYQITLHIGYTPPKVIEASIPVGTDGVFACPWADGDLVAGEVDIEVQVVSPSGKLTWQRNEQGRRARIKIYPELA